MKILAGGGATACMKGQCPTLYRDADGKLYVQGFRATSNVKERMGLPINEDVVEISESLLEAMKKI
jgi:hypothetical protein